MANLFYLPFRPAYDAAGISVPGAQLYFTLAGTNTASAPFQNEALSVPHSNPVVMDGAGKQPAIYLDPAKNYRVRVYARGAEVGVDTPLEEYDPYVPGIFADAAALQPVADAAANSATAAADSAGDAALSATAAGNSATAAAASATEAQGWADVAANAAPSVGPNEVANVVSRAALAVQPTGLPAFLTESGREGQFVFSNANLSTLVAADTQQGIYVAPSSDPTGASGAWVRKFNGMVNVKWFGAVGDGVAADGPKFVAAIAALKALAGNAPPLTTIYKASGVLFVPAGHYKMGANTLDITHTLRIQGEGGQGFGAGGGAATMLEWSAGTTGIRIQAYNTSGASTVDGVAHFTGGSTELRDLYLYGGFAGVESEAHGVHVKAGVIMDGVQIENFAGDALYAHTSVGAGSPNEGNSNCSKVTNCHFRNCRNGVSLAGGDSNAWQFTGCWFDYNRRWGADDLSFLGNTYIGGHADGNGITDYSASLGASVVSHSGNRYAVKVGQEVGASTNAPSGTTADNTWWYYMGAGAAIGTAIPAWSNGMAIRSGGAYRTDDGSGGGSSNASNVFVGMYSEGGQGPSQFSYPTLVYGGTLGSGVKGYAAYSQNYQGWWRVGLSGRGAIFDGSTTVNGAMEVNGGTGSAALNLDGAAAFPQINFKVATVTNGYILLANTDLLINGQNSVVVRVAGTAVGTFATGSLDLAAGAVHKIGGTQVVGARQAAVADASNAAAAPTQAEFNALVSTVNSLLAKLRTHGLIAP